jgi:hypothetical protein
MRTGERVITLDQDKDGNIVIRPLSDPGIYVPTGRFSTAVVITIVAFGV